MIPQTQPEDVFGFTTDAAPLQRAGLDAALTEVAKRTGDPDLVEEVSSYVFAYAREVADRAFILGLELGRDDGRLRTITTAQAAPEGRPTT